MIMERLVIISVVAAAACGRTDEAMWSGTITDSAGVVMVANTGHGVWGEADAWRIEEELRLGTADGAPEYQFGTITAVDVDSEGRIYVLDQHAQAVRVFDRDGGFVRTIGRAGAGPGELSRGAVAVLVGPGDTLAVPDIMLQRVNRFLPDGSDAGSYPLPLTGGVSMRWQSLTGGRLAQQVSTAPLPGLDANRTNLVLVRGAGGAILDTLLRLPVGEMFQFQGSTTHIRLFEAEALWDAAPEGPVYSGLNTEYRIEVRSLDGTLLRTISRPFERQALSDKDRQVFLDAMRDAYRRYGVPPEMTAQLLQNVTFAEFYPAYSTMAAGAQGTLWVQRIRSAAQAAVAGAEFTADDVGSAEWEVFAADGRYLGVVTFPARFRPLRFREHQVFGVWKDELEVEYLMRLRVVGAAQSAPVAAIVAADEAASPAPPVPVEAPAAPGGPVAPVAAAEDALPAARLVIDRYVAAAGGRERLLRHHSSRVTGTFTMPDLGMTGRLVTQVAAPNLTLTQVDIAGLGITSTGFDGTVGWALDPRRAPRLLEGSELAALAEGGSRLAALRDPSLFDVRETVERTEFDGQACFKVRLVWKSGRQTFDCYSVATGLRIATIAQRESAMGIVETVSLLDNYREVQGVLTPTRMRQVIMGMNQVTTLDTIEYDVVDPAIFALPDTIRSLVRRRDAGSTGAGAGASAALPSRAAYGMPPWAFR